ncbi:NAD(P)H-binding protein [Streptomyces sp. NBC_01426]|uniref:NAD(P)H-binding protein n=1 Tax=Streptomyces sp. NBC_01426 TaxID=2975866 RepID=UPI002E342170|nr:NAD(P)H-binding protein [Streptomyces sp. NBC_01426]
MACPAFRRSACLRRLRFRYLPACLSYGEPAALGCRQCFAAPGKRGKPDGRCVHGAEPRWPCGNADAVVFTAGSNGGSAQTTKAIDGDGLTRAIEATRHAGIRRLTLVSVLRESWRERNLDDEVEYYFTVKKQGDIALSRSDLDWLILRPSLLTDDPGVGTVSLGTLPAYVALSWPEDASVALVHRCIGWTCPGRRRERRPVSSTPGRLRPSGLRTCQSKTSRRSSQEPASSAGRGRIGSGSG